MLNQIMSFVRETRLDAEVASWESDVIAFDDD
jgi:hypothetical protein